MDHTTAQTVLLFPRGGVKLRTAEQEHSKKHPRKRRPVAFTLRRVERYFDMPQNQAATAMGVSLTTMKQVCRRLDIKRWPYRRPCHMRRFKDDFPHGQTRILADVWASPSLETGTQADVLSAFMNSADASIAMQQQDHGKQHVACTSVNSPKLLSTRSVSSLLIDASACNTGQDWRIISDCILSPQEPDEEIRRTATTFPGGEVICAPKPDEMTHGATFLCYPDQEDYPLHILTSDSMVDFARCQRNYPYMGMGVLHVVPLSTLLCVDQC